MRCRRARGSRCSCRLRSRSPYRSASTAWTSCGSSTRTARRASTPRPTGCSAPGCSAASRSWVCRRRCSSRARRSRFCRVRSCRVPSRCTWDSPPCCWEAFCCSTTWRCASTTGSRAAWPASRSPCRRSSSSSRFSAWCSHGSRRSRAPSAGLPRRPSLTGSPGSTTSSACSDRRRTTSCARTP